MGSEICSNAQNAQTTLREKSIVQDNLHLDHKRNKTVIFQYIDPIQYDEGNFIGEE